MARTRTLLELLGEVADRADMDAFTTSTFVTKAQATRYLNQSAYRFWGRLVKCYGDDYFHKTGTIAAVNGTAAYALPTDCFQPKFFRVTISGTRDNIPEAAIEDMDLDAVNVDWTQRWPKHKARGVNVEFFPTPRASYTVTVHYIPQLLFFTVTTGVAKAELVADGDYMDGQWGWEEWIVMDAVRKCVEKEERDTSSIERELAGLWDDIAAIAPNRTATEPTRVRDVYRPFGDIDEASDDA